MTKTVLRSAYIPHARVVYTGELVNHKTGEVYTPVSRVKQSFVAECDINNILKQYSATGQLKHISAKAQMGAYQDLPDEIDFQSALNLVNEGERAFATLPSKTRDRFGNDPANFLEFMADPQNQDEAIKLGLATKRPETAPKEPQAPSTPAPPAKVPEGS
jgi:phage internal scaffolding protein